MTKGKKRAVIGAVATVLLVGVTGLVLKKQCYEGSQPWTCTLIMQGAEGPRCRLRWIDVCATNAPLAIYFTTKRLEPFLPGYTPVDSVCNQQRFQTDTTFPQCKVKPANAGEGSP